MKIENYIDDYYYVLWGFYFVINSVLALLIIFLNASVVYLTIGIVSLVILLFLAFLFYFRKYQFQEKEFRIQIGCFIKKIPYKKIKKCYITENKKLSYATSIKRLCINLGKENIFISPKKIDEVLFDLIKRTGKDCK